MIEDYFYVIDGLVFGEPRRMTQAEAAVLNAEKEKMKLAARWLRQHEFVWIDDVKV